MREPLKKWHPYEDAGGVHKGTQPVNIHPMLFRACNDGKKIDSVLYEQLHTTIDLDGLFDLLEMQDVLSSWKHAERKNMDWRLQNAQQQKRRR